MAGRDGVERRVRREFFPEDCAEALAELKRWREKGRRMRNAVLCLARGSVDRLRDFIRHAYEDYRDVLWWSEDRQFRARLWCVQAEPAEPPLELMERAFLDAIDADPDNDEARSVYADWLEERGDGRGEYLRLLCRWLSCKPAEETALIEREKALRPLAGKGWLAAVRGLPVKPTPPRRRFAS